MNELEQNILYISFQCMIGLPQIMVYSGRTLKLYITFVPVIRTSKPFWLLQYIWHQTMVIYPWCITTCSHWNHFIWSQELWEHKFLVFKNGLLFYRFMVEWVSFLHKMVIKGLITVIYQSILTTSQPWVGLCFIADHF